MNFFKSSWAALGAALLVAACGGGGDGNQAPRIAFTSIVSFGDSLSDGGTYRVGSIAAAGGGKFTVNDATNPNTPTVWTEFLAAEMGLATCAARVGGYGVAPVAKTGCRNYAQGGARVENPKGVGNATGAGDITGALTHPVVTQIANYAIDNGSANFTDTQLVTVLAGANDIFGLTDQLKADATAAGNAAFAQSLVGQFMAGAPAANQAAAAGAIGLALQTEAAKTTATPTSLVTAAATGAATHAALNGYTNTAVANAVAIGNTAGAAALTAGNAYAAGDGAKAAVTGMAIAATKLAGYVKANILAKGATHVVVSNLPDVSLTPMANAAPETKPLILAMTTTFNKTLQDSLAGTPGVVFVDAFSNLQDQVSHKERYGLSNVTATACDLTKVPSSLVCSAATTVAGDSSRYMFADAVHPTPFVYKLQAQLVATYLAKAGWL
ncbi:MAG: SGNH/GDSL hydrolase family protein [Burkholderiales bacterium]|nr:SGNH/GDSL hydrolase family protein [Burkholderiales bacterium]